MMKSLKIKVNNQAESKEAQELFFDLGFNDFHGGKNVHLSDSVVMVRACDESGVSFVDSKRTFNYTSFLSSEDEYEKITLPQLRDKVALHRNDVRDATHGGGNRKGYLSSDGIEYVFRHDGDGVWKWSKLGFNTFEALKMVEINKSESEVGVLPQRNPSLNDQVATAEVARQIHKRSANDIASAALVHISDRAATYDQNDGERSAHKTAMAFNAITGKDLTEGDVWHILALLKMVRQCSRPEYHQDSAEDLISYSALWAECLERDHGQ